MDDFHHYRESLGASNLKEIPMVWKGEVEIKSKQSAIQYRSHGKYKVFQKGDIISGRHKGTSIIQCLQNHMDWFPYQLCPHQNDIFQWNFIFSFRYFLVCNFVI